MAISNEQIEYLLNEPESENLEFKEASNQFDQDRLTKYIVALANARGGKIVFGVGDKRPRKIVGTKAFPDLRKLQRDQSQRVHLHLEVSEVKHPSGRVVVIAVPSRPVGTAVQYNGAYWMRRGEDLVPMSPEVLKGIFDETQPDFSAEIMPGVGLDSLDVSAVELFRKLFALSLIHI